MILGAAFVFGHYVNQNSISASQLQEPTTADNDIVWQGKQEIQQLRGKLDQQSQSKSPAGPDQSQSKAPVSSMPIAGLHNRPVVRKPFPASPTPLVDPFSDDTATGSRQPAPKFPSELPPLVSGGSEDAEAETIVQPDFSGLIAAAKNSTEPRLHQSADPRETDQASDENRLANASPSERSPDTTVKTFAGDWAQPGQASENPPTPKQATLPAAAQPLGNASRLPGNTSPGSKSTWLNSEKLTSVSKGKRSIKLQTNKFITYQTRANDTLQSISIRYFGKPDYYLDIYVANRDQLANPASVPTGVTLQIPVYED